jgi:hypothetical protein
MTREERELSIAYLEEMKEGYIEGEGYVRHPIPAPEYFAIETAIEALKQEPCEEIRNVLPVDVYPYTGDKYTVSLDISNIPENIIEGLSQSSMALEWIEDWVDRWVIDNLTNVDHYAIDYENSSLKDKFPIEETLEDDLER